MSRKSDRDRMVEDNARLAYREAHRVHQATGLELDDLMQCALIGLTYAAARFDPERGLKFSTFAVPYCRGEVFRFVMNRGFRLYTPSRWRQAWSKGRKLLEKGMTDEQVAEQLQIPLERWIEIKASHTVQFSPVEEALVGAIEEAPEDDSDRLALERVEQAVATLPPRKQVQLLNWVANYGKLQKRDRRRIVFPRALFSRVLMAYRHGEQESLNQGRLLARLQQRFPQLSQKQLRSILNATIEEITDELATGNVVRLRGLGSLQLSVKRGSFRADARLKARVSKLG